MQGKRNLQKENTRSLILKTAVKVYAERGFSAPTSIIAKAAGVSHGTVFSHFPAKDDLLICLISAFGEEITTATHALASGSESLEGVLRAHLAVLSAHEMFYIRLISEINLLPLPARHTFFSIQSAVSFHIAAAAEKEIKSGKIKEIPAHMIFNAWVGLIHYYLQNKIAFAPDSALLPRYQAELVENYLLMLKV